MSIAKWFGRSAVFLIFALLSVTIVAQELCEELAREIFEDVSQNCSGLEGAKACFGHGGLSATFNSQLDANTFRGDGDTVDLKEIYTLRTEAFDAEEEEWGIGRFQIPVEGGDPLVIIVAGDVIVENAVDPNNAEGFQPMQAFNFTTGGSSSCRQAPNAIYIQGAEGQEVDLRVNSTPIRMGSSIVLGSQPGANGHDEMWFALMDGTLEINPGTPEEVIVPEGAVTTVLLSDEEGENPDGEQILSDSLVPVVDPITGEPILGPNGEPFYRQVPVQDFAEPELIMEDGEGILDWETFQFVEEIPDELLNYEVDVPEPLEEEIAEPDETVPDIDETDDSEELPVEPEGSSENISLPAYVACSPEANWCQPGGPWGDGRCNDPELSGWYWEAGYYNAQQECGIVEEIPEEYVVEEPTPAWTPDVTPTVDPSPPCYVEVAPGLFEEMPAHVRNGSNDGNWSWQNPSRVINFYSGWLVWDSGTWYTGYHNDCWPLGLGSSAQPPFITLIP